ncbi:MAG: hypothetical protein E7491_00080 [Ruminococcaceae bacterium]|nr:hypothetical protein [Oscillospiraceae bacterium]
MKKTKITAIVCSALIFCAFTMGCMTAGADNVELKGDIDGNGKVDIVDVLALLKQVTAPKPTVTPTPLPTATPTPTSTPTPVPTMTPTPTPTSTPTPTPTSTPTPVPTSTPTPTPTLTPTPTPKPTTYTVRFVDYDGAELKTEIVEKGARATAPATPTRSGYIFIGWNKAFDNVTSDLTVTAQYELIIGAYLGSANQTVEKGATLSIPVQLLNCSTPIKTMGISISNVPTGITIKKGTWSSDYEYEMQNFNKTRLQGASTLTEQGVVNGNIFDFQFTVSDSIESGVYTVEVVMILKYFDMNEDELSLPCQPVNVQITVN